eukprot:PITA_18254
MIEELLIHHKIKHRTSTPYHPQANGQVEVTNKALENILTKVVTSSRKYWAKKLVEATWAYKTTWNTTTGFTPSTRVREQLQDIVKDQSITIQRLESKILSPKEDLKKSREQNREEHEVIKLKGQVEEGRRAEEDLRNLYLKKEEQHQVEVNILKGKLEEKDKLLRFQDSTKVLDNILNSQRSPAIKTGLGFHEYVEGESSSQGEARNSKEKSEMLNKEQPRKEIPQGRSFTPNYGRDR